MLAKSGQLAIALVFVLGVVNLVLLARPCEVYRLRVAATESGFSVRNTVALWDKDKRVCVCLTVGSDDPLVIAEGLPARRKSQDRGQIIPEVRF